MTGPGVVPAGHGRLVSLHAGQRLAVINTFGTQVVDTWAFSRADPAECMSMAQSRSVNSRLFALPGQCFVSTRRRAMLRLVEDTSPGYHDTLLCACNGAIYRELGCAGYHRSCEDNLHEAAGHGRHRAVVHAGAAEPVHERGGRAGRDGAAPGAPVRGRATGWCCGRRWTCTSCCPPARRT